MTSKDRTPTPEVLEMNTINFSGDVMPRSWFHHLRKQNKKTKAKPYTIAIVLLADIVYWYRPSETRDQSGQTVELHRRFAHEQWLQRSYGQYMDSHGFSKTQIRDALRYLEGEGLIELIFRPLKLKGYKRTLQNVMYIRIIPSRIREITHSPIYKKNDHHPNNLDLKQQQNIDTCTETTTENTTDKNTSGKKMPEQTHPQSESQIVKIDTPQTQPSTPDSIHPEYGGVLLLQEAVVVIPENELTTRIARADLGDEYAGFVDREPPETPPDDNPKYEASVGRSVEILPDGTKVVTLPPQPPPEKSPRPKKTSAAKTKLTKDEKTDLLKHFCATTGIIAPLLKGDTKTQINKLNAAAQVRWFKPLVEMARICVWDIELTKKKIDAAWGKFVGDGNGDWITAPQSLVETVRGMSKGKGKAVAMLGSNGGGIGLTAAHRSISLFGKNGGGK